MSSTSAIVEQRHPQSPFGEVLLPKATDSGSKLLSDLRKSLLIRPNDWDGLHGAIREELERVTTSEELLEQLTEHRLLTEYQVSRIRAGKTFGLILGNYRVLNRLGSGGMGIIYKAEHLRLPRLVAIKVLSPANEDDPRQVQRFGIEIGCVAQMQHPNIVGAIDAGEVVSSDQNSPSLPYFVMEYIPGQDLQAYVETHGPLSPDKACDLMNQLASALVETDKHHLIHRDIKPSNVLVTPDGVAKLLDFGLARQLRSRMTVPGSALGTIDYLAPEQARDASSVDIRADIYGLGGTLFWCLTGHNPFPSEGNMVHDLLRRLGQLPPSIRKLRPELSEELDILVRQMLAVEPGERIPTPQAVMQALLPFLPSKPSSSTSRMWISSGSFDQPFLRPQDQPSGNRQQHVLVVDDEPNLRKLTMLALQSDGIRCDEVASGREALQAIEAKRYDLVLSDIDMPEMTGPELLEKLRQARPYPHLKIIMFSGRASPNEMAQLMSAGADDYLTKPLSIIQLRTRVKAVLRLKEAQDRSDQLNRNLVAANHQLQQCLAAREREFAQVRDSHAPTMKEFQLAGALA